MVAISISLGCAAAARADDTNINQEAMLRNARYCTQYFSRYERTNGIPKNLLMAISSTESGRYNERVKMTLPWPWTINVDGQGKYFNTMHEAVVATRNALNSGANNVDVGCMQISLKHHPDAFVSLTDAFSPEKNVAYGAKFLREKYDEERSWKKAIAAYHSKTTSYGQKYYASIIRTWRNVLSALGNGFDVSPSSTYVIDVASNERTLGGLVRSREGLFDEKAASRRPKAGASMPTMKVIQVTTRADQAKRPEVLVIRPASAVVEPNVKVASNTVLNNKPGLNKPGFDFVMDVGERQEADVSETIAKVEPKVSTPASVQRVSSPKRGPNFIFAE
ncbi:MAG: transglycosylase SLT domain-containing protein [Rickettsiales bacterium]